MQDIAAEILRHAQQGDLGAFEQIYRHFGGFVYSIALRITNNAEDAQEAAQDVFIKVYKYLNEFKFPPLS